jgi:hypothetical protein
MALPEIKRDLIRGVIPNREFDPTEIEINYRRALNGALGRLKAEGKSFSIVGHLTSVDDRKLMILIVQDEEGRLNQVWNDTYYRWHVLPVGSGSVDTRSRAISRVDIKIVDEEFPASFRVELGRGKYSHAFVSINSIPLMWEVENFPEIDVYGDSNYEYKFGMLKTLGGVM